MTVLVGMVLVVNFQAGDVRAETFGQKSMLYAMVASDDFDTLETVKATDTPPRVVSSSTYISDTLVDARKYVDFDDLADFATPNVGTDGSSNALVRADVPKRGEPIQYTVQDGDTLGQIAEKFALKTTTILWANGLTFTSTIHPGDDLKILPKDGVVYTVKSGDTP